jgi:hypothetical protein
MSLNPDDEADNDQEKIIQSLRDENNDLKKQIDDLTRRVALYEMNLSPAATGPVSSDPGNANRAAATAPATVAASEGTHVGRKSVPFSRRNSKQHQGRMTYLLKKLEMGTSQTWTQDAIADLHTYCTSDEEFFKKAVVAYEGADSIADMDVFIAMLQSHNS